MNKSSQTSSQEDFVLTFADLLLIVKKNARKILNGAVLFALLAVFYGLTKPVEYVAEATFKEKGKSQSGLGRSLSEFLLVGDTIDSDALTILKSRRIIEEVIQRLGLQATISKNESLFPFLPIQNIKNNLLIEYALFKKRSVPILKDRMADLKVEAVSYQGEIPLWLEVVITSPTEFTIFDEERKKLGEGTFAKTFNSDFFSLKLLSRSSDSLKGKKYSLNLQPLGIAAKNMSKKFTIETDRNDKNLLNITYKNSDRHDAVLHLEALMDTYQDYLYREHQRISNLQVDYLTQRQKKMASQLEELMRDHARELSSDLSTTGFATSSKAMDFLATSQQELKQKLLTIDLEIQRLENLKQSNSTEYENSASIFHPEIVNPLTTEIRSLKQQADALSLAIRSTPLDLKAFQDSFSSEILELDDIKQCSKEANLMLASIENDLLPDPYERLMNHPKYIIKIWYDRLAEAQAKTSLLENNSLGDEEWQKCKQSFKAYLTHLIHYLYVNQRNIEERLAHQRPPIGEFQGINLSTAREVYIAYSRELSDLESQIIQQQFIVSQLIEPNFEISSLSAILTDPISSEMISKASNIVLALKDQDNRSLKEQERLKNDLDIQKKFLTIHLQQTILILELRQKFLKEKIHTLQSINLSLIQEQISILENQLKDYISSAIENLKKEQSLLEKNLLELRREMAAFPQKWTAEQLIQQQMDINQNMVEEIAKLVESKNISNNLEKIQSAPIDLPLLPIHPKSPNILFLAIIGALAGSFLTLMWVLARSVVEGVQVTENNLRLAGQHVSGYLSRQYKSSIDKEPLRDQDLSTLRHLIAFISDSSTNEETMNPRALLLLKSQGPDYSSPLAELMGKTGLKVLILDLCFESFQEINSPGILQYLEGKISAPPIFHEENFDRITCGGITRFGNELFGSDSFKNYLEKLQKSYDWVIAVNATVPTQAAGENLIKLFHFIAVTITNENLQDVHPYIEWVKKQNKQISFIITE